MFIARKSPAIFRALFKQSEEMLSPTLKEGLKAYGISPTVRPIRLKKKMGLVELGRHTALSPGDAVEDRTRQLLSGGRRIINQAPVLFLFHLMRGQPLIVQG